MTCKERHETPTKYRSGAEHPPAAVKPGAISDPYGDGSQGQVHGQEEPYCLNDHDTDAIEVDSPSRRSRCSRTNQTERRGRRSRAEGSLERCRTG